MAEIEQGNVTYNESLDQFQGNMDILPELFRTQKDSAATAAGTPVEIEMVAHLIPYQSGSLHGSNGHSIVYPWGMPQNSLLKLLMVDLLFLIIQYLFL